VRRWGWLFPPRDKARQAGPVSDEWSQARLKDARWVATARQRLQSLSWFMKCLADPLSRLVNREEQTRGAFFEGRFKSVAILDEASLLVTCAYIDPVLRGRESFPRECNPRDFIFPRPVVALAAARDDPGIHSC